MSADTTASAFGLLIKQRREALDLTQGALARQIGYSADAISLVETGRQRPSKQLADRLAAALGIPPAMQPAFVRLARGKPEAPLPPPAFSAAPLRAALPTFLTPFRGRETELAQITHLVRDAHKRLVTLTGFGGVGKTRLAVQAAVQLQDHFPAGVVFVDLAAIRDPTLVVPVIAGALGYTEPVGRGGADLAAYLRDKQLLLVLDNCEQIPQAGRVVHTLVAQAPRLVLLITSRATLRLPGEQVVPVLPLPIPPPSAASHDDLESYAGVQLFVERAQEVLGEFAVTAGNVGTVRTLCRKLAGIPLAIELAAAWLRLLPLEALLPRLEQPLGLLADPDPDRPAHQAGLRATLEWSYNLLGTEEQWVFAHLGVFAGSWAIAGAEAVLGRPLLPSLRTLAESNLIDQEAGGAPGRYTMLEVVREYALQQLTAAGEGTSFRQTYAQYYLQWVQSIYPHRTGPQAGYWFDQLELEYNNLRAVLSALLAREEREAAAQLCSDLIAFWTERDRLAEGEQWLRAVLAGGPGHTATWGRALTAAGFVARGGGDYGAAQEYLESSLAIFRQMNDRSETARTLRLLGAVLTDRGDYQQAMAYFDESLEIYQDLGDQLGIAVIYVDKSGLARAQGHLQQVQHYYAESLAISRAHGFETLTTHTLVEMGKTYISQGAEAEAIAVLEECRVLTLRLRNRRRMAYTLLYLGMAQMRQAVYGPALSNYRAAGEVMRDITDPDGLADCLEGLGECAAGLGDWPRAIWLLGFTTTWRRAQRAAQTAQQTAAQIQLLATLGTQVSAEAFETAWRAGEQATLEEVLAASAALDQNLPA
ncbi:MAG TPA: tetratricopeptide repeat protein [Chloroflexia bacterium]|nr:tetratricopeptide repeat protein [Chloroflexia bacterium]